jgi:hypothetical protein
LIGEGLRLGKDATLGRDQAGIPSAHRSTPKHGRPLGRPRLGETDVGGVGVVVGAAMVRPADVDRRIAMFRVLAFCSFPPGSLPDGRRDSFQYRLSLRAGKHGIVQCGASTFVPPRWKT